MANGCVKGPDDCGCDCHRTPGVIHVRPCCDKMPMPVTKIVFKGKEYVFVEAFDKDRDPGDEDNG